MATRVNRAGGAPERKASDNVKRSSWISVLAAGGLLVAGCSSGSGTAAPANTVAAASTSSGSSTDNSSTDSSSTDSSSSDATSSSEDSSTQASAAELDEATTTWFTTFCTSLADIGQYTQPDTTGQSLTEAQSTVVTAYTGLSTGAAKAAVALQAAEPPTITGGDEVAAGFVTGFQNLADVYGRGAQTVAALTPSTASDIKSAIDAVEQEAKGAQPESMPDLDPGVQSAVEQLPECSNLGN